MSGIMRTDLMKEKAQSVILAFLRDTSDTHHQINTILLYSKKIIYIQRFQRNLQKKMSYRMASLRLIWE